MSKSNTVTRLCMRISIARLNEAYVDICDYFDLEGIPNFAEKFPKEFSLKHVTEIWKYAVRYQQEQISKQQ